MPKFEIPKLLKRDAYNVSTSSSHAASSWECKETPPSGGGAQAAGSGWCK